MSVGRTTGEVGASLGMPAVRTGLLTYPRRECGRANEALARTSATGIQSYLTVVGDPQARGWPWSTRDLAQ